MGLTIVQELVNGVSTGGTYALSAVGFVLIFGVANVLNIAQAETIMLCPTFAVLLSLGGVPAWPAIVLAVVLTAAVGMCIHVTAISPFLKRERRGQRQEFLGPLIATFGLSLFFSHLAGQYLGTEPRPFPLDAGGAVWRVGGLLIGRMQVVGLGVVAVLVLVLALVIKATAFGRAMRAVAENPGTSEGIGIPTNRVAAATAMIAAVLGGVAGLLFAADTNSVTPFMGLSYGLKGLVVMIVGGVTSMPGAIVAGVLLGVTESLVGSFLSSSYVDVVAFGLLFAVLLIRPRGLFVGSAREARP